MIDLLSLAMALPATFAMKAMRGVEFPTEGGTLSGQVASGELFGAMDVQVTYTPPQGSDTDAGEEKPSKHQLFQMAAVGYAFSAGIGLTWAVNISRFMAEAEGAVGEFSVVNKIWRGLGALLSAATWALSNDFIFDPKVRTKAQQACVANLTMAGIQMLVADVIPAIQHAFRGAPKTADWTEEAISYYNANLGWFPNQEAYFDFLRGVEVPSRESKLQVAFNVVTQLVGFLMSVGLIVGFTVQGVYEIQETKEDEEEQKRAAVKMVQNLFTTVDHLLSPFESLFEKWPEAIAFYFLATGFCDVSAATINGLRAYENWPDTPHLNM